MNTTAKHTPGKWHVGQGNGEGFVFADDGRTRYVPGRGTTLFAICTVHDFDGEKDANARLIASAPELLQALQFAARLIGDCQQHGIPAGPVAVPSIIYDAIRKATGEA